MSLRCASASVNPHRILFVELLGGIGDTLIALPAIQAVAQRFQGSIAQQFQRNTAQRFQRNTAAAYPNTHLTVLTFAPGASLLQQHPLIQRVVPVAPEQSRAAVEAILREPFDLIVSDTNYEGIDQLIEQAPAQTVTNLWRSPPDNQRVSDRFLALLHQDGVITHAEMNQQPRLYLAEAEVATAKAALGPVLRPLVCLCPEAGTQTKRWPVENFVALGRSLQAKYGTSIVVPVGDEPKLAEAIAADIGGGVAVWPRGELRQLAALLQQADAVVAADTGPARIAAALNVPTVTLFGPAWSERYGQPAPHVNLQGYPNCPYRRPQNFTEQECWYGECPLEWKTCTAEISPERVLEAIAPHLKPHRDTRFYNLKADVADIPAKSPNLLLGRPWNPAAIRRLLVMRLDNIGDVVMTTPALRSLRQNLPEAHITLLASPAGAKTAPLLPWVNEVIPWRTLWQDLGKLPFDPARERSLAEKLRAGQFDAAVIFTSFSQSPHPAGFLCQLADIPRRLGESKETDLGTLTHAVAPAPDTLHQVERNLRLIEAVGLAVKERHLELAVSPTEGPALPADYIVLNPWTTCQSRNYASDRFAEAALKLSKETGYPIVVTGVEGDRAQAAPLLDYLGTRAVNLIGQTSLEQLVAVVAGARLMLSNNTSTMHIADATQTPSVITFAGTELEGQWRPRTTPTALLRRPTTCSPCYQFECPYRLECLDIEPESLVEAGLELI
ncbi:MAG: glycosyltransferase family 9 protein [Elainellaceae cyanobacterium]